MAPQDRRVDGHSGPALYAVALQDSLEAAVIGSWRLHPSLMQKNGADKRRVPRIRHADGSLEAKRCELRVRLRLFHSTCIEGVALQHNAPRHVEKGARAKLRQCM